MANLDILTTQNVNLQYKVASIGERVLATLVDFFLFFVYLYVVEIATDAMDMAISDNWTVFGLQQLLLFPVMFYSLYMPILFDGRTFGKMITKTKVVRINGSQAHWSHYLIRWMLRLVDIWIFFGSLGLLFILFSDKRQRIGDHAAGTVVINTKYDITIDHTILENITDDYVPVFHQVIKLTDKDVRLIKETYRAALQSKDYKTLNMLRKRVETVLETSSELYDEEYLDRILRDYNFYTQSM